MYPRKPAGATRVHPAILVITAFAALLLQTSLPPKLPLARLFEFPLLITVYFSMSRQDKIFGIGLGTGIGLLQDALSHGYLGLMGMSKALVGYLAASVSVKFELDNALARGILIATLVVVHSVFLTILRHGLLDSAFPFEPFRLLSQILVNVAMGLILFHILDQLRKPA